LGNRKRKKGKCERKEEDIKEDIIAKYIQKREIKRQNDS
jgi:hypothetical protein